MITMTIITVMRVMICKTHKAISWTSTNSY